jgi:arabinan endo-1,5-alpha-L-arabinosidase
MKRVCYSLLLLAAWAVAGWFFWTPGPHIHDPSTIIRCKDEYWFFTTGLGVPSWHSRNLIDWREGPRVFSNLPGWITKVAPGQRGYFWAPDVIHIKGRYLLYYAVSKWASRTSAIGLATNPTLDPSDPAYHWSDEGIIVRTTAADNYNAIDPSVMMDVDNRMWMAFGSFWSGIKLVELDPATGLRKPGAPLHALADAKQIEAPCIISHQGTYYLFVNWGLCCRGVRSTYEIRVGRSPHITGPYLDKNGVNMLAGGGSLFLAREGRFIGPGQAGILRDGPNEWLSYHYYDGGNFGLASLGVRKLEWDRDRWPVAGENAANLISSNKTNR